MKQQNRSTAAVLTAALLALAAAPAAADWLVTRQGGKVETKGAWQVKGKLVVFTLPDGKLSSLRATEVDLDASRRATEEAIAAAAKAQAAPLAEPAKPREAKVVLTDESFRRAAPPAPAPDEETKEGTSGEAEPGKLTIASWERVQGSRNVVISGTVRNDAPTDATGVTVTVLLYDETGKLLVTGDAVLGSTIVPAGQSASFQADFTDIYTFAAAKFEASGLHILREAGEPPKAADGN